MEMQPAELMQSVLSKLYEILSGGDDDVPRSDDNFLSWCSPGIPMPEESLQFLKQGLSGAITQGLEKKDADGNSVEISAEEREGIKASETGKLYMQAENLARLLDFIPNVNTGANNQLAKLSIMESEGTLSDVYKYVLQFSQVASAEISDDEKAKLDKYRELLQVKRKKKDLVTDEEVEVVEPSPMVILYNEKMNAYLDAVLEYNSQRVNALSGVSSAAIHSWTMNASVLRNRVKNAMNEWISTGYKNEYEGIAARIDQIMSRDLSLLKAEYKDTFERAKLTGLASNSDFYFTSLIPGNFMDSKGWPKFEFSGSEFEKYKDKKINSTKIKGSTGFLGFGAEAGYEDTSEISSIKFNSKNVSVKFEIAEVQIARPWFKTVFLNSKSWKLDPSTSPEIESRGELLSDGQNPPKGIMPAYPISLIFIRNLEFNFGSANSEFLSELKRKQIEGKAGYGPFFNAGADYSTMSSKSSSTGASSTESLKIEGMSILAFRCHGLELCPSPLDTISTWV